MGTSHSVIRKDEVLRTLSYLKLTVHGDPEWVPCECQADGFTKAEAALIRIHFTHSQKETAFGTRFYTFHICDKGV